MADGYAACIVQHLSAHPAGRREKDGNKCSVCVLEACSKRLQSRPLRDAPRARPREALD